MGAEASQGGPGGWWILGKPEIHFGEHVVVPDIAGWRRERLSVVPDKPFMTLAPDWVCEVQDSAVVRASPFEAVELELGRLWADATP